MTHRDHVIEAIERLMEHPTSVDPMNHLESLIAELNVRSSNRFRRNPWIWIATGLLILPMLFVFGTNAGFTSLNLPAWIIYVCMIGGLFGIAWIWQKLPKHIDLQLIGIAYACHDCGYNLEGHDSVLGEHAWVGPEVCPECGTRFPAIG